MVYLETKNAEQQLKTQAVSLQALEKQLTSLRKENMALADQLLDKDAELASLQSKVEAIVVEKEHQTKFEELKNQLEAGLKKQQSMELESKIQLSKIEKERDNYLAEYQQQQQQLSSIKEELAMTHQSFNEYKLRAQRILQVMYGYFQSSNDDNFCTQLFLDLTRTRIDYYKILKNIKQ